MTNFENMFADKETTRKKLLALEKAVRLNTTNLYRLNNYMK